MYSIGLTSFLFLGVFAAVGPDTVIAPTQWVVAGITSKQQLEPVQVACKAHLTSLIEGGS